MSQKSLCPFTRKACIECALYRGRHHYLRCWSPLGNSADTSRKKSGAASLRQSADLRRLRDPLRRGTGAGTGLKREPKIRLKITDIETGKTRACELSEAKTWDWTRSQMLRLIDGWQVTSLDHLMEIVFRKAEKGYQEVEICEAPRFMLFSGG